MRVKLMVPNRLEESLHLKAKAIAVADSAKLRGFCEFAEQMKADFGKSPTSRFKYCGNLLGWLWLGPKDSQDLYLHIEGNVLLWGRAQREPQASACNAPEVRHLQGAGVRNPC